MIYKAFNRFADFFFFNYILLTTDPKFEVQLKMILFLEKWKKKVKIYYQHNITMYNRVYNFSFIQNSQSGCMDGAIKSLRIKNHKWDTLETGTVMDI